MPVHQWLARWSTWGWPLLANHLWLATLLSLVALGAVACLTRASGRARYAVLLIASSKFALPSAVFASLLGQFGVDFSSLFASKAPAETPAFVYQLTAPVVQLEGSAGSGLQGAGPHNELFCALSVIWLTVFAVFLALWWRDRRRFRVAMRHGSVIVATRERLAMDRVRSWLGIKREVRLLLLPDTIEPGVWGVWRPIVLLPECMAEQLDDAELEAVMMHEMIHVARRDNLVANLHRLLCCMFWFHPIVWVIDRLLLAERERACDDEVIKLGGAYDVYASSLLKVLRFCLGWNVAGASNATGSNLGRRVERIMSNSIQTRPYVWHRVAVSSIATLVVTISVAASLLTRGSAVAQNKSPDRGVTGGITGGVPGGVPGGVASGVSGGVPGGVAGVLTSFGLAVQDDSLIERLKQAPESSIEFKNSGKAPLAIADAKVKQVPSEKDAHGDLYAVVPIVTLSNNTDRRIKGFTLEFRNGLERRAYYERVPSSIDGRGVYVSGRQNRFVPLVGGANGWTLRVAGVVFEDGDVWGEVPPPPPPPRPRDADSPKPPPPPPPSSTDSPKSIRKNGGVLATSAIKRVDPEYPALAKAANVTGTVVVEITVDETGNVISARSISGHPLLKAAALDAARQWQFTPTTLSGEPVKVVGTLTFNFEL